MGVLNPYRSWSGVAESGGSMGLCASSLVLLLNLGLFLVGSSAFPSTEVDALNSFKEAIYEDPLFVLSNWNVIDSDPCDWSGVFCSMARDHVLKLNISGASLKGFLAPELHYLTLLQELILHGNFLIGTIPKEIGLFKDLKVLDLSANQLTGPIPQEIGNLTSIVKLNLQSNGLTGRLPPELGTLKYLEVLRLDRNKLQGTFPASNESNFAANDRGMYVTSPKTTGLCRTSQLKVVDFSFNFFTGTIPKCFGYLPRSSFQGNCLKDKNSKQRSSKECGNASSPRTHAGLNAKHQPLVDDTKHKHHASRPPWLLALEVVTGTMVGSLFLIALFTGLRKCKSKSSIIIPWKRSTTERDYMSIYIDPDLLKDITKYNRHELEIACEDFSNIIGSSPDSQIYKGTLKGGPEIAVVSVCCKEELWTGFLELYFQKEVADFARLRHDNVGKLLGYCRESSPFTRMLVFEYASNGTLSEHLHYGEGCQMSWTRRMKIIIGIARGLRYLHTDIHPPFTISELNTNAVYLTEDFSPKLVDFESSKAILSRSQKNSGSISNEGAICVLPNALEARHLDIQGNIYTFGVLLLEIISGRLPYSEDKGSIIDWAKQYLEVPEIMSYLVDPELKHFRYEDLKVICEAIHICIEPSFNRRTTMRDLCAMLEGGIETSISAEVKASSLAWAELALSS